MTEDAFLIAPKNDVAALQAEIGKQHEEIRDLKSRSGICSLRSKGFAALSPGG